MNVKMILRFATIVVIILVQLTSNSIGQVGQMNHYLIVGDLKVYMLQDAQIYLNVSTLSGIEHKDAKKLVKGNNSVHTRVNAYLVQTPNRIILVDAGIGKYPPEDSGHLIDQMKAF